MFSASGAETLSIHTVTATGTMSVICVMFSAWDAETLSMHTVTATGTISVIYVVFSAWDAETFSIHTVTATGTVRVCLSSTWELRCLAEFSPGCRSLVPASGVHAFLFPSHGLSLTGPCCTGDWFARCVGPPSRHYGLGRTEGLMCSPFYSEQSLWSRLYMYVLARTKRHENETSSKRSERRGVYTCRWRQARRITCDRNTATLIIKKQSPKGDHLFQLPLTIKYQRSIYSSSQ